MRKIEELKVKLLEYFNEVEVAWNGKGYEITDVLLVLRKDNIVYKIDFATDIFRFSPSFILNHILRSISYGNVRNRKVSLEERFITDALLEYRNECCYVRLLDGILMADGLEVDLNNILGFSLENGIISLVDNDSDIFVIDLQNDVFEWISEEDETDKDIEISAFMDCIQKYLQ